MFTRILTTGNPDIQLVAPVVSRDAALGVAWIAGRPGRETLALMGVADADNRPTSLEQETARVQGFLNSPDHYNWMIEQAGQVIGSVWVDLRDAPQLAAPSVHIMIGQPQARGQGVGRAAMQAVIEYLTSDTDGPVHSRHLVTNTASRSMLIGLGFTDDGPSYTSAEDGFSWQNLILK